VTATDRLTEIADLLALGLQRLIARQSSELSADRGESSLHFTPDQSGGSPIPVSEDT
jgi:hypothetical protein